MHARWYPRSEKQPQGEFRTAREEHFPVWRARTIGVHGQLSTGKSFRYSLHTVPERYAIAPSAHSQISVLDIPLLPLETT